MRINPVGRSPEMRDGRRHEEQRRRVKRLLDAMEREAQRRRARRNDWLEREWQRVFGGAEQRRVS